MRWSRFVSACPLICWGSILTTAASLSTDHSCATASRKRSPSPGHAATASRFRRDWFEESRPLWPLLVAHLFTWDDKYFDQPLPQHAIGWEGLSLKSDG